MTEPENTHGAHSVLLGLASRQTRRRDAARYAIHLLTKPLPGLPKRPLSLLFSQLDDWTLLVLAAVAAGMIVGGAAYVLLLPPDLAWQRDPSGPFDGAICGPAAHLASLEDLAQSPATLPQPEVCALKLSDARID